MFRCRRDETIEMAAKVGDHCTSMLRNAVERARRLSGCVELGRRPDVVTPTLALKSALETGLAVLKQGVSPCASDAKDPVRTSRTAAAWAAVFACPEAAECGFRSADAAALASAASLCSS